MSDLDQIKALDSGVAEAINAGDAAAVTAHYTDDAAIHPPGAVRMDGKAAVQGYWQPGIDAGPSGARLVGRDGLVRARCPGVHHLFDLAGRRSSSALMAHLQVETGRSDDLDHLLCLANGECQWLLDKYRFAGVGRLLDEWQMTRMGGGDHDSLNL